MANNQGPDPEDLRKAKKLLEEIERIYKRIGINNPLSGAQAQDYVDKIGDLKSELEDANDIFQDMDGGANDILKSWKAIVNEAGAYKDSIYSSKSGLSSLSNISEKVKNSQRGIEKLSEKDLKNLKAKFDKQKAALRLESDSLANLQRELETKEQTSILSLKERRQLAQAISLQNNINGLLNDRNSILYDTEGLLESEERILKRTQRETGVLGGLFEGLSKSFPRLSETLGIKEAQEEMKKMAEQNARDIERIAELKQKQSTVGLDADEENALNNLQAQTAEMEGMGGKMKMLGKAAKVFGENLTKSLGPLGLIAMAIEKLVEITMQVDQGAGDYAKNMNVTYEEALKTRQEMAKIAAATGDVSLNSKDMQETLGFVGQQLGTNAKLNQQDLITFTKLREQAGLTNEELYGIQELSFQNGKTLEQNSKDILGGARAYAARNKLALNEKQILKDVSKASASLKLSLGGSATALAESAAKARQFGLSLEQAEKISQSLLNFESSIENELSAELLTGKQLNLERARSLSLSGDAAGAAAEIAKQVGTAAEFGKMNVLQQDALAKAAGMEREELAKSLMEREALAKIGAKDAAAAKAKYDELRKTMSAQEAAKALGDEALANQYEQQSVQERFNKAVEKLQEIFVQIAEPLLQILSPLMDLVGKVLPLIVKGLQPILAIFSAIGQVVGGIVDILSGNFSEGLSKIGEGLLAGIVDPITSMFSFGNDVISPGGVGGGYGKRTLLAPEGAIQLNNKDTIIAGTNLFGDDVTSEPGKSTKMMGAGGIKLGTGGSGGADMSQTNDLLRELISTIRQTGTVTLDGQKVGEALKVGTYKVQ